MGSRWTRNGFVYLLILVAAAALFFSLFPQAQTTESVGASQVAQWISEGKVETVEVEGEDLLIKLKDGQLVTSTKEEEVSFAIANITVFGIVAMVTYPFLAHWIFSGDTTMTGLFTGTAIHETAQVAASGLIYDQTFGITSSPTSADIAMVTKLVRNVLMAIVIPLMTFIYMRRTGVTGEASERGYKKAFKLFPLFILGFLFMAILRSIGDAGVQGSGLAIGLWNGGQWVEVTTGITEWSGYILATAMAGVGLGTSFKSMKGLGIKPFFIGLFSAALLGVVAIIMIFLLGRFVSA